MKPPPPHSWPLRLCRLSLGGLFIWSGLAKLLNPLLFADALRGYEIIGDPLVAIVAIFLPSLELVCGLGALLGSWWRGATAWLVILCAAFILALGSAWFRGLEISCGCFGPGPGNPSQGSNYPVHLAFLGLLAGMGLWMLFSFRRSSPAPVG